MSHPEQATSKGLSATITSEIMVGVVVILFLAFVVLFFFYLYAKRYHGANPTIRIRSSRNRFILAPDHGTVPRRGLDPAVIQALPVTVFRSDSSKEGLECAVCLCELSEGEEARSLPKCSHGFHLECIDMWFRSNNTCPLCRSPVCSEPGTHVAEFPPVEEFSEDGNSAEPLNFPANTLVWGSRDRVSTGVLAAASTSTHQENSSSAGSSCGRREGMLAIEIPRRAADGFPWPSSPLPSSRPPTEEIKSPLSARLRSLTRLLSRGRVGDIEEGTGGVGAPIEGSPPC